MKRFTRPIALVFLLLIAWAGSSHASHQVGSDMTWACNPQNPCVYTFTYTYYRDCPLDNNSTTPPGLTFTCDFGSGAGPTTSGPWVQQGTLMDITPICAGQVTDCSGGNFPGFMQAIYTRDYNFCNSTGCGRFAINWTTCCRSNQITSGAASETSAAISSIRRPTFPCNNSPVFSSVPVVYICGGQSTTYSLGATDPEGDLLQYSLIPCMQTATTPVTYNAGFSPTSPIGATWNVTMDPATGDITFAPINGGVPEVGVMCVQVDEIRNNRIVGTVVRDIEVRVINCSNQLPTLTPGSTTDLCVGQPANITINSNDADVLDVLTVSVVSNTSGAAVNISGSPHPTAQVTWTPTTADIGTYTLVLEVRDNACPINGVQQFTYVYNVISCDPCDGTNQSANWTSTQNLLDLTVTNTSTGTGIDFTEFSWGDGSPTQTFPGNYTTPVTHTFPGPGEYEVCVKVLNYVGDVCCHDSLCKKIVVSDDPCFGQDADFNIIVPIFGCTYTFIDNSTPFSSNVLWDFGNGQGGSGSPITYTFPAGGFYQVSMTHVYHPPGNPQVCCTDVETKGLFVNCPVREENETKKTSSIAWNQALSDLQVQLAADFQAQPGTRVALYDIRGKLLQDQAVSTGADLHFDLTGMPAGIYLVQITNAARVETRKFVKQ